MGNGNIWVFRLPEPHRAIGNYILLTWRLGLRMLDPGVAAPCCRVPRHLPNGRLGCSPSSPTSCSSSPPPHDVRPLRLLEEQSQAHTSGDTGNFRSGGTGSSPARGAAIEIPVARHLRFLPRHPHQRPHHPHVALTIITLCISTRSFRWLPPPPLLPRLSSSPPRRPLGSYAVIRVGWSTYCPSSSKNHLPKHRCRRKPLGPPGYHTVLLAALLARPLPHSPPSPASTKQVWRTTIRTSWPRRGRTLSWASAYRKRLAYSPSPGGATHSAPHNHPTPQPNPSSSPISSSWLLFGGDTQTPALHHAPLLKDVAHRASSSLHASHVTRTVGSCIGAALWSGIGFLVSPSLLSSVAAAGGIFANTSRRAICSPRSIHPSRHRDLPRPTATLGGQLIRAHAIAFVVVVSWVHIALGAAPLSWVISGSARIAAVMHPGRRDRADRPHRAIRKTSSSSLPRPRRTHRIHPTRRLIAAIPPASSPSNQPCIRSGHNRRRVAHPSHHHHGTSFDLIIRKCLP